MRKLPALVAVTATAALALTACTDASAPSGDSSAAESALPVVDLSGIEVNEAAAELLPADVAEAGTLVVASETSYAPAEFLDTDGTTPVGYDIDIAKAIGATLGLEVEIQSAPFDSIIPAIGTKYDVGMSSFTITDERTQAADMTQYLSVGEAYAVLAGNPGDFSADDLCGATVAVQVGTIQEEEIGETAAACESAGADAIEILTYETNADATTNLVGGKADVMFADSPIVGYAITQTGGKIEQLGDAFSTAPQGVVTAKDSELTEAIAAAIQSLMDSGELASILETWGVTGAALDTAEINPAG